MRGSFGTFAAKSTEEKVWFFARHHEVGSTLESRMTDKIPNKSE